MSFLNYRELDMNLRKLYYKKFIIIISCYLIINYLNYFHTEIKRTIGKGKVRFVFGIITNKQLMNTLVEASKNTWIPLLPYDLFYFIDKQKQNVSYLLENLNIIELSSNDREHSLTNKTFDLWTYFYEKQLTNYDYFVVLDSKTYVNTKILEKFLQTFHCYNCYVGYAKEVNENNRFSYCLNRSYIISQHVLRQFGPFINKCRQTTRTSHSDVELGRCIYTYASDISCTNQNVLFQIADYQSAFVYPLETSHAFHKFHQQIKYQLRPILPPLKYSNDSCVANPIVQNEIYRQNYYLSTCHIEIKDTRISSNLIFKNSFIITLPGFSQRLNRTIWKFQQHNIHLKPFEGVSGIYPPTSMNMTRGEWNIRLAMKYLIQMAINNKFQRIFVVEDDAIPHRQLHQQIESLFHDNQCQQSLANGVLLLGTSIWPKGWKVLSKYNQTEHKICRHICTETYGAFAVLLHRVTFQPILTWLNNETNQQPYDCVFSHLARLGYSVRFAWPNLVINDVRHISLTRPRPGNIIFHNLTYRAKIHRWNLTEYMISEFEDVL